MHIKREFFCLKPNQTLKHSIIIMLLKIVLGSQIRLFDCKQTLTLEALYTFIEKTFPHLGSYSLYYFDQENDQIILETKQDVAVYLQGFDKKPKIHIRKMEPEDQVFERSVKIEQIQEKPNLQKQLQEKVQQVQKNSKTTEQVKYPQVYPSLQREEKKQEVEFSKEKNNYILHDVQCKGCQQTPIKNIRYKCGICEELDLCQLCFEESTHKELHAFAKIRDPKAAPVSLRVKFGEPQLGKEQLRRQEKESEPQKDQQLVYESQQERQKVIVSYLESLFGQENYETFCDFARQSEDRSFKKVYESYLKWLDARNQPGALRKIMGWVGQKISTQYNKFMRSHLY